eukprot:1782691-Prymnesium_polylepis.3
MHTHLATSDVARVGARAVRVRDLREVARADDRARLAPVGRRVALSKPAAPRVVEPPVGHVMHAALVEELAEDLDHRAARHQRAHDFDKVGQPHVTLRRVHKIVDRSEDRGLGEVGPQRMRRVEKVEHVGQRREDDILVRDPHVRVPPLHQRPHGSVVKQSKQHVVGFASDGIYGVRHALVPR